MEKGESLPEKHTLIRLAKALNLDDEYFIRTLSIKMTEDNREILDILREIESFVKRSFFPDQLFSLDNYKSEKKVLVEEVELSTNTEKCFTQDFIVGKHWLPADIANGATYLTRVCDNYLEPFLLNGEMLLICRQNFLERDGQLAVINVGNQANTIKFVYINKDKTGIGKSREEATWFDKDEIKVLGVVVNKISTYGAIKNIEEAAKKIGIK
jgi:transcriptional regulator with XRE-family HTH domain